MVAKLLKKMQFNNYKKNDYIVNSTSKRKIT